MLKNTEKKPILYIDMDGTLVDFVSVFYKVELEILREYDGRPDDIPGIFALMEPMPGAIEAVEKLRQKYDLYILSPWENPTALGDKLAWVKKIFWRRWFGEYIFSKSCVFVG